MELARYKKNYDHVRHILIRKDEINKLFEKKKWENVNMEKAFYIQRAEFKKKKELRAVLK